MAVGKVSHVKPLFRATADRVTTSLPVKRKQLTTIGLITQVSAVWSVVTQVFSQDTCPVTTPVLI